MYRYFSEEVSLSIYMKLNLFSISRASAMVIHRSPNWRMWMGFLEMTMGSEVSSAILRAGCRSRSSSVTGTMTVFSPGFSCSCEF